MTVSHHHTGVHHANPIRPWTVLILVGVAALILSAPLLIRSLNGNHALIGPESYAHLGVAQNLVTPGSYPIPAASATLFDVIVAGLLVVAGPLVAAKLFPLLLGCLAIVVFLFAAKTVTDDNDERILAAILLIASPLFIVSFATLSSQALAIIISLGAIACVRRRPLLMGVLLLTLTVVNVWAFAATLIALLALSVLQGSWRKTAIAGVLGIVIIVVLHLAAGFLAQDILVEGAKGSLGEWFGNEVGYLFFILFLAVTGFLAQWRSDRKAIGATIIAILAVALGVLLPSARVVLLPMVAILAAKGFLILWRRKWSVGNVRDATMFLLCLSLLFTLIAAIAALSRAAPSVEQVEAFTFLQTSPRDAVVLSSPENGVFIERLGRRTAYLDELRGSPGSSPENAVLAEEMFSTRRMADATTILEGSGVTYLLIDDDMRAGGVWSHEEEGLLFLLEHSPYFIKLHERESVSVYRYDR